MTHVLLDTSVLIKWFHEEGESELPHSLAIRNAHIRGDIDVHILELGLYEVGNVLTRALHWPASQVADQLDDLSAIVGPPLTVSREWLRSAAELAEQHRLTFYDACWAAAAAALGIVLVSADRQLLTAGLAESPTQTAERLRLPLT